MICESKDEISAKKKSLFVLFGKYNRGDSVDMAEIEASIGIQRHAEGWQHILKAVDRRMQKERHIALYCPGGKRAGHCLLMTLQEQITDSIDRDRKRALRVNTKSRRKLRAASADPSATDHQRRFIAFQENRLKCERSEIIKSKLRAKKTEVNPIRRPPAAVAARTG